MHQTDSKILLISERDWKNVKNHSMIIWIQKEIHFQDFSSSLMMNFLGNSTHPKPKSNPFLVFWEAAIQHVFKSI